MICRGVLKGLSLDWHSKKPEVTLQLEARAEDIERLQDKALSVELKQYREKRSLDANAYAWVLISRIAAALNTDKDSVYESMLQDYGFPYVGEDGIGKKLTVLKGIDPAEFGLHVKYIGDGHVGGKEFSHYLVIRGSSEYDTREMSSFIDSIVQEARELGIETLTPTEIGRMMDVYEKHHTKG